MMAAIRPATPADLATLLPMVRDLHEHEGIRGTLADVRNAVGRLLAEPQRGRILLAGDAGLATGYVAVCFGYSIEFHGVDAFVDELYVLPPERGQGLGQKLLDAAEALCRAEGVVALHLEVDHANPKAHALYQRKGFKDHARHLMTKRLGGPEPAAKPTPSPAVEEPTPPRVPGR
jgi:GNAT superfamily N-acetyltransferase